MVAIIGFDGMDIRDINQFNVNLNPSPLKIDTVAHTVPSWYAIASGNRPDGFYNRYKLPDDKSVLPKNKDKNIGNVLNDMGNEFMSYDDFDSEFLWDINNVNVISYPISVPAYSNITNVPFRVSYPVEEDEMKNSMNWYKNKLKNIEGDTIVVLPQPDKLNHKFHRKGEITNYLYNEINNVIEIVKDKWNEWVFISDHGRPSPKEYVYGKLWVASHKPEGIIDSNCFNDKGLTNISVFEKLDDVL